MAPAERAMIAHPTLHPWTFHLDLQRVDEEYVSPCGEPTSRSTGTAPEAVWSGYAHHLVSPSIEQLVEGR
jgi:hypothetical protein